MSSSDIDLREWTIKFWTGASRKMRTCLLLIITEASSWSRSRDNREPINQSNNCTLKYNSFWSYQYWSMHRICAGVLFQFVRVIISTLFVEIKSHWNKICSISSGSSYDDLDRSITIKGMKWPWSNNNDIHRIA